MLTDYDARCFYLGGCEIKLIQTEYNIITLLSEHAGKMLTYSAIIAAVWGTSDDGSKSHRSIWQISLVGIFGVTLFMILTVHLFNVADKFFSGEKKSKD